MRINWLMLGCLVFLVLLTGCTKDNQTTLTVEEAGEEVIGLLQGREYDKLYEAWFSSELQESLSVAELSSDWEEKVTDGDFVEVSALQAERRTENLDVVEASLEYTAATFDIRLIFNEGMRLVGLSLSDGFITEKLPGSIMEEEIIIGEGTEYELGGLLTLPKDGKEELPAVVLVHGSGPSDRDESAFAYKPFRDIAWGLAEQGIAVIRYDKRTFTYGNEMAEGLDNLTVYEETVEDAIRAAELIKTDSRIDEQHVFLAGHSLGGMLAPRIDAEGGDFSGFIILAGSPRPLWEIIYDQNRNLIEDIIADEKEQEEQRIFVEEEYEKAKSLQTMTDEEAKELTLFGIDGYYLKEMAEYNIPELVEDQEKPLLILQGEDDFQVFYDKDYKRWQEILEKHEGVTFISYPGLNHFFIAYEGAGKGTLAEYEIPNQVDEEVIQDIGEWIFKQSH
ncbi:alpha/beta hydrolase [Oceanobacillus alkalisoli]|uniref:alpha/beta hydrolase n=1 Tax=Oceanobacillus alkalisoli TaxID=2925113 RepID=UPI001EE42B7B|nr:alpha/beta fold hydrolase [Oceanobacillus alkalisoli]MCG5103694.1 alpha/beta fold hydrolase [Oceanobacillus alkalisoli]